MKAILEFDLPDDARDLRMALKINAISAMIWEFNEYLRGLTKHGEDGMDPATCTAIREAWIAYVSDTGGGLSDIEL